MSEQSNDQNGDLAGGAAPGQIAGAAPGNTAPDK